MSYNSKVLQYLLSIVLVFLTATADSSLSENTSKEYGSELTNNLSQDQVTLNSADYIFHMNKAAKQQQLKMGKTDKYLFKVLNDTKTDFSNKDVAVICPFLPYYECIALSYGGNPTVITNKTINTSENYAKYTTFEKCKQSQKQFDYIICISQVGAQGLGNSGEKINPNGDLEMMVYFENILKENGKLILSLPVGKEKIIKDSTRIYGSERLKKLFQNWRVLKYYDFTSEHLHYGVNYQPIFLLEKKE